MYYAYTFYRALRQEVMMGNPQLTADEQHQLQSHYPVMMTPSRYPAELAATIYATRRTHAVCAIRSTNESPVVFDAGCGYGSESYLFASLGARVLAVDWSAEQIAIGQKRQAYYEAHFGKALDIQWEVADLNQYTPSVGPLSLTWLASVLAAIPDQNGFLARVVGQTQHGGQVMVTDMNLMNPLFCLKEWRRRRRFVQKTDFWGMVRRRGRIGARYEQGVDDVQFFTAGTLARLMRAVGLRPLRPHFSGYLFPQVFHRRWVSMERGLGRLPLVRRLGYFYVVIGTRDASPD